MVTRGAAAVTDAAVRVVRATEGMAISEAKAAAETMAVGKVAVGKVAGGKAPAPDRLAGIEPAPAASPPVDRPLPQLSKPLSVRRLAAEALPA